MPGKQQAHIEPQADAEPFEENLEDYQEPEPTYDGYGDDDDVFEFTPREGRKLPPKGNYDVIVDDAKFDISNKSGAKMIVVNFRIIDGGGEWDRFALDPYYVVFTPKSKWRYDEDLPIILGRPVDLGRSHLRQLADEMRGRSLRASVITERFEGRDRPKVDRPLPPGPSFMNNGPRAPERKGTLF